MKPEMALKAAKLIHTGEVFTLGFHLSAALPLIGSRRFDMHMKRSTATDPGTRGENEEIVITELGQVGTQLDAFAHQIYGGEYYNCITNHEMSFGDGGQQRLERRRAAGISETWRRENSGHHDARRADRRGGPQECGHAARRLRHHGGRFATGAGEGKSETGDGRRGHDQHGLGQALQRSRTRTNI